MNLTEELKKDEEAIERIAFLLENRRHLGLRESSIKKIEDVLYGEYAPLIEAEHTIFELKSHIINLKQEIARMLAILNKTKAVAGECYEVLQKFR